MADVPILDPGKEIERLKVEIERLTTRDTGQEQTIKSLQDQIAALQAMQGTAAGKGGAAAANVAGGFWEGDDLVFTSPDGGRIVLRRIVEGTNKRVGLGAD